MYYDIIIEGLASALHLEKDTIREIPLDEELTVYGFDSLAFITLVVFLEDKLTIAVEVDELVIEKFLSIERIDSFLIDKLSNPHFDF